MPFKVLVIDHDLNIMEEVQRILMAEGYEVLVTVTGQGGVALAQLHRPSLVLLDINLPDIDGYEVCRVLRATPATAKLPILIYSARAEVADKVAGFRAGANDYIVKPAAPAELIARIKAALRIEEQVLARVVALWGAKGGVGTTTTTSNLTLALRSKTGKRVTLVDASVLAGTVGVMLNLTSQHTIADLLPRLDDLDSELLSLVLTKHSSGVKVLLSMPWSMDGEIVQPAQLERILTWLRGANDYIVVDTGPPMDQNTLAVLQLADQVVLVLTPEITALRNARLLLKWAETGGQVPEKFMLALNRYPVKGCIKLKDIEGVLHSKITIQIPDDEALVTYSINRGIPLVVSHPRSPIAQSANRLADLVIAKAEKKKPPVTTRSTAPWARLLLGRLLP